MMRGLDRAVEWLRPLVETNTLEYCVVWKQGDDPSSFIEWMGSCCSGGYASKYEQRDIVKLESGEDQDVAAICKDMHFPHILRTKACEALAKLPSSMSLYSGIHGEVVISNQPRWLNYTIPSDSNASRSLTGTHVLIPVIGGLIELFTAKHIPRDQKIIDYITARCTVPLEQEVMSASCTSLNPSEHPIQEEDCTKSWQQMMHMLPFVPEVPLQTAYDSRSHPSREGSSFDSERGYVTQYESMKQRINKPNSRRLRYHERVKKQLRSLGSDSGNVEGKGKAKAAQGPDTEYCLSKNLVSERNRRTRIRNNLYALRALVPKISKMDRAAIVLDAIDYVKELQQQEKELLNKLTALEAEDLEKRKLDSRVHVAKKEKGGITMLSQSGSNQPRSSCNVQKQTEVRVEIMKIGTRAYLIEVCSEHMPSGFRKLMECLYSEGLVVVGANVTTLDGKLLNILKVEAHKEDIQPQKLRDFLIEEMH